MEGDEKHMILVDLEVPSMRKSYQFRLEENCRTELLIAEIAEMISQKERCRLLQEGGELELYSVGREMVLDRELSLAQQQIREADRLLLL